MNRISAHQLGLAGGVCTLIGIGMARFAYTPLIPALVEAGWFSPHDAAYLGAINLLGYLIGAATAHRATLVFGVRAVLGACLAITAMSFYACALDAGVYWYGFWRLACGVTGAMLVVVGAPAALSRVSIAERAGTSARVFTGIGLGVMASGTLVPWLADIGVAATWIALALVATALSAWAWFAVLRDLPPLPATDSRDGASTRLPWLALWLVIGAYGLDAIGFVPHTLFWVDYIARELGQGLATGSGYWVVFGVGAMCGPIVAGMLAARVNFRPALAIALTIKTAAVSLPLISSHVLSLGASSFLVGLLVPATVTLTSGSVASLCTPERQQQLWGWATLAFALAQAASAYGMSWGYEQFGSYRPLFVIAVIALAAAAASAVGGAVRRVP
ncbi:YbfB/YjiJ family MFS transporter [Endozoicomonas sp. G2_2]|uniref:YbfB/YjiJ family MFS transporter n=1 Tax=Endozoicomonas sp. G2_2 TaxID=2821092 RepID=UPI001AD984EF|nr:YbfB/YjiJ family MFS transporter [Endozoicomonas sp. G2_2]MBO9469952.1 YbfB/YjiJ family MFS transporter [Endozoicomonas sp. G2_2]